MKRNTFNIGTISVLFGFFILRPFLDTTLACAGHLNLPFFRPGGLGLQSLVSLLAVGLGWAYIAVNREKMPGTLVKLWLAISVISLIAAYKTPEMTTALSFFFRLQLWFCLFFVFQSLDSESVWKKRFVAVGIGTLVFYLAASVTDTLISGGKMCVDHRIWEMASVLYPNHQYSEVLGVMPYLFLAPKFWNEKSASKVFFILCALTGVLVFYTGVRHIWLGLLAFTPLLLRFNSKNPPVKKIKIGAVLLLAGFVGGILSKPFSFANRFSLEIPILIYSAKKMVHKQEPEKAEAETKQIISSLTIDVPSKIQYEDLGNSRFQMWIAYMKSWRNFNLTDKLTGRGYQTSVRIYGKEPHSDFFRLLLDLGLVGLVLFFWFLGVLILLARDKMGSTSPNFAIFMSTLIMVFSMAMFSGILAGVPTAWHVAVFLGLLVAGSTPLEMSTESRDVFLDKKG